MTSKSEFFRGCFEGSFKESDSNSTLLEDDTPGAVAIFLEWLYTSKLRHDATRNKALVENYKFADKILCEEYHNTFMDTIRLRHAKDHTLIRARNLVRLYDMGLSSSPLARFGREAIGQYMVTMSEEWVGEGGFVGDLEEYKTAPEVMSDLMVQVLEYQINRYDEPDQRIGCHFHHHKDGTSCSAAEVNKDKE